MEAFFRVIGRGPRQHDFLELYRVSFQALIGVTSPFKAGMMLAVLAAVFLARSTHPSRLAGLLTVGVAGVVSSAQVLLLGRLAGMGMAFLIVPSTLSTFVSLWYASRQMLTGSA
jgi:hypothetical protein